MTEISQTKARLILPAILLGAAIVAAIEFNRSRDDLFLLEAGVLVVAATLPDFVRRRQEPYFLARWLFGFCLLCSWQLVFAATDPDLRHGAWIAAGAAGIGSLIGYEMKLRAVRLSGDDMQSGGMGR